MKNDMKLLTCPNCDKKFPLKSAEDASLPFCSKRCKMVDLGNWLGEKYVLDENRSRTKKKEDE